MGVISVLYSERRKESVALKVSGSLFSEKKYTLANSGLLKDKAADELQQLVHLRSDVSLLEDLRDRIENMKGSISGR